MKDKYFPAIILGVIGAGFLLFGLVFGLIIPTSSTAEAKRIESFTPVSVIALRDMAPGQTFLVEGRISPDNITHQANLVSYIIEAQEYDSVDEEYEWVAQGRNTPPLTIDTPAGALRIDNENYALLGDLSLETVGDTRYRGFEINSPVTVIGLLQNVSDGIPHLQADLLAVGAQAEAVEAQYKSVLTLRLIGGIFGAIGIGLLIGAGILAVKL